ncbi:MAG: rhodanese-like domain-containing protein [Ramlibacter sp.]|nr:rhodanese-like domain-containing protein [Ramlibacter sp.]
MNLNRHERSRSRVRVALLSLLLPLCAQGQQGNEELPEALRNIPRAGESCKNDAPDVAATRTSRTAAAAPGLACMVTMSQVRGDIESGAILIVDVRQDSQHQRFHIPGSVNFSATSLAHKPALRGKALLLVGDGKGERELHAGCSLLKQSGFASVRVLAGGMISYLASGAPLRGRVPSAYELADLDAGQLWAESKFVENLLVIAGNAADYSDHLPYATAVNPLTPASLAAVLDRRQKEIKGAVSAVVLAGAPVTEETSYAALATAVAPVPLLTYRDSAAALGRFVAGQKASWTARARGPKRPRCG